MLAAVALAQAPPETASVQGSVTHSVTGAPILRAHISLRGTGPGAKSYGALTTAEGKFTITGIEAGAYQASTDRVGFYMPAEPGGNTTVAVALRAGDKKDGLNLRLTPFGSISGKVVDAEGEPVGGATVAAETGPGYPSSRATTDDQGRFLIGDLRPGKYRLKATMSPVDTPPEIRTDGTLEIRYAPTYYPGVTDYRSAVITEVRTGAEINGVDVRLLRQPIVRVSGKLLGVLPDPRSINLLFSQTAGTRQMGGVKQDGTFEVWNVDPGKYFLSAAWRVGNQRVQTAPVNIEIGQSNVSNIELRVVPPSDMMGQVVFDDEQAHPPRASSNQQARQGSAGPSRLQLGSIDPGVPSDRPESEVAEDGSFHLTGVQAARYRVILTWPSAYVREITLGSNRVEANWVNLRDGAAGVPLTVLVSSAFGSISGEVSDGDVPVAGARIALVRDDYVSLGDITFVSTDASGSYSINNVRPGNYRIAAIEEYDNAARLGNLDDYEDIVAHIEVQPKDKLTKDLKRYAPIK